MYMYLKIHESLFSWRRMFDETENVLSGQISVDAQLHLYTTEFVIGSLLTY